MKSEWTTEDLAKALFVINRHAKTAPDPTKLYQLKKQSITKLLKEKKAKKIGLHFSDHPKLSKQHSTVLIKIADYYFHIPAEKDDFKHLAHLGDLDKNYRNPKPQLSLSHAKKILSSYLGIKQEDIKASVYQKQSKSAYYTPSSLGQFSWPSKKKFRN